MNICTLNFNDVEFANLIFIPVFINGQEIVALFDTGAQKSFITNSVAEQLKLTICQQAKIAGNNQGSEFKFSICECECIKVGTFNLSNVEIGILPDEYLDFGVDENNNSFPAKMLLGMDIISQLSWEFDMNSKTIRLQECGTLQEGIKLEQNTFPTFVAIVAGEKIQVGFDSGHTESMLDYTWKEKISNITTKDEMIYGVGSQRLEGVSIIPKIEFEIDRYIVTLENIEILEHEIYGVEEGKISVLLGADILTNAIWKIDFQSGYFFYTRNYCKKEPPCYI